MKRELQTRQEGDSLSPMSLGHDAFPFDLRGGVHFDLVEAGSVTFVLYAPFKPYASLVGDFNRWDARAHPMQTDGMGVWWITLPHPGATRYGYYVAVDEQSHVWVGDPYATHLSWDEEGPWAYLPEAPDDFVWTDQEWRTLGLRELVIYELCVRDFAGGWRNDRAEYGTFRDMLSYVDYLNDLGVNAIELMPVQAFPGESSWGYNPVFYFAPAQVYGSPDDLKALVDACHARGIAVILDVAFNHSWGEHPYYAMYPPLYSMQGERLDDFSPFFHHTPAEVNMWGGVDWDHFAPPTTRYFQDVVGYWLEAYHIDGFRFDWVCGVDYDSNDPWRPGFHPFHGIAAIAWAARQAKPDCILLGEYWQLDNTHPDKTAAKMVHETEVDAWWNGHFHHTMEEVLNQYWQWEQQDLPWALGGYRMEGFDCATQIVNYTCSHDEVRPEHEIKFYSRGHISRPAGMNVDELALRKAAVGLAALFAAPGIPMIYAGQEFGEDAPRTIDFCPLDWDKLGQPGYRAHYDLVARLIAARRSVPALKSDEIAFEPDNFAETHYLRLRRWADGGSVALAALNFGERRVTLTLDLPYSGIWRDVVQDRTFSGEAGVHDFALEAWSGLLLVPGPG